MKFSDPPVLPLEIWEHVIDMHACYGGSTWELAVKIDLQRWMLVCRAWVPRCRLYLSVEVRIASRDTLEVLSKLWCSSPFHAARVKQLKIVGGQGNQSWISSFPLRLPKLPNFEWLTLEDVDLSQLHPSFARLLSLLRRPSGNQEDIVIEFTGVTGDLFDQQATQLAIIANALRPTWVLFGGRHWHEIRSVADVTRLNQLSRRLTSAMVFRVDGDVNTLASIRPSWRCSAFQLEIVVDFPSHWETTASGVRRTRVVWTAFSRMCELSEQATLCATENGRKSLGLKGLCASYMTVFSSC